MSFHDHLAHLMDSKKVIPRREEGSRELQRQKDSKKIIVTPPGGLEPPTSRLTVERASQLRHGGSCQLLMKLVALIGFDVGFFEF